MMTEHNVGSFTHLEHESAVISRSPPKTAHKETSYPTLGVFWPPPYLLY